jgi:hypothetical protein
VNGCRAAWGDELVRLLRKNGKGGPFVALVFRNLPNAREHQRLSVLAADVIGLLAAFIPPFIETLSRDNAALRPEMLAKLPFAHSVGARIEQRRSRRSAGTGHPQQMQVRGCTFRHRNLRRYAPAGE